MQGTMIRSPKIVITGKTVAKTVSFEEYQRETSRIVREYLQQIPDLVQDLGDDLSHTDESF